MAFSGEDCDPFHDRPPLPLGELPGVGEEGQQGSASSAEGASASCSLSGAVRLHQLRLGDIARRKVAPTEDRTLASVSPHIPHGIPARKRVGSLVHAPGPLEAPSVRAAVGSEAELTGRESIPLSDPDRDKRQPPFPVYRCVLDEVTARGSLSSACPIALHPRLSPEAPYQPRLSHSGSEHDQPLHPSEGNRVSPSV